MIEAWTIAEGLLIYTGVVVGAGVAFGLVAITVAFAVKRVREERELRDAEEARRLREADERDAMAKREARFRAGQLGQTWKGVKP